MVCPDPDDTKQNKTTKREAIRFNNIGNKYARKLFNSLKYAVAAGLSL
jgi:hypothetical protein